MNAENLAATEPQTRRQFSNRAPGRSVKAVKAVSSRNELKSSTSSRTRPKAFAGGVLERGDPSWAGR